MNKLRRQELKKLKYKKRLQKRRMLNSDTISNAKGIHNGVPYNLTSLLSHSAPCSCSICSYQKYNRAKEKADARFTYIVPIS